MKNANRWSRRAFIDYLAGTLLSANCKSLFAACCLATLGSKASADFNGLQRVVQGAGGVTVLAAVPGDPDRLLVGGKEGLLRALDLTTGEFEAEPFLNLLGQLDTAGEGGLMGLAFHPDFQTNGKLYVTVTIDNGGLPLDPPGTPPEVSPFSAHVREYRVAPGSSVAGQGFTPLLQWVKPQQDHTGGWLGFSPNNGYLYIATGDGGGGLDDKAGHTLGIGNAQDLTNNLMGKILRINVDSDAFPADPNRNYAIPPANPYVNQPGDDEIFAYGLRSPWKSSFDRATGDLWIGDVGEDLCEEVDFIAANSAGGENFGWRLREGTVETPHVGGAKPPGNDEPVYNYAHIGLPGNPLFQGNSITGGYVYRGPDPTLTGKYVFADFIAGDFWMFDPADPYGTVANITPKLTPDSGEASLFTTMTEDAVGNLYVGTITGNVFRLATDAVVPGDFQPDARVDYADLAIWRENFGNVGEPGEFPGDANGNGAVGGRDFLAWQRSAGYSAIDVAAQPAFHEVPEPLGRLLALISLASLRALRNRRP